jgi:hypothetical protein
VGGERRRWEKETLFFFRMVLNLEQRIVVSIFSSNNKIKDSQGILKLEVIVTVAATLTTKPPLFFDPIVWIACGCPDS